MYFVSLPMYRYTRTEQNYDQLYICIKGYDRQKEQINSDMLGYVAPHCYTRPISSWPIVFFVHLVHNCKLAKRKTKYFFVHRTNQQTKTSRVSSRDDSQTTKIEEDEGDLPLCRKTCLPTRQWINKAAKTLKFHLNCCQDFPERSRK